MTCEKVSGMVTHCLLHNFELSPPLKLAATQRVESSVYMVIKYIAEGIHVLPKDITMKVNVTDESGI